MTPFVMLALLIPLAAALVMVMLNLIFAPRLEAAVAEDSAAAPRVSLLVPVRNEEENLTRNLPLLLQSDYEPLEIILLDDESTDSGRAVAERLMASSNKDARWVKGKPWTPELRVSGKSNACQQLAELASGEVLIFCDADVAISRHAVSRTVKWLQHSRSAGLTALPQQRFVGWRERLALPWIMQLPIAMTVPFFWSWRSGVRSLQLANGQWLALRAQQYHAVGGHRSLGSTPLEDVALAQKFHGRGVRGIRPVLALEDVRVQMYTDWPSLVAGFAKNLVAIFGGSPIGFVCAVALINMLFFLPLLSWLWSPALALFSLLLIALIRFFTALMFRMPLFDLLLHPLSLGLFDLVALRALQSSWSGKYVWKERVIAR